MPRCAGIAGNAIRVSSKMAMSVLHWSRRTMAMSRAVLSNALPDLPAGKTGPVTGLWHRQTQPSGMTVGPAIPAIRGQRKVPAGVFDSAGLAVRIRTEGWQDDVAARPHTGLPPYMHVSAATCRPALWPDRQVPREYVPISEPVRCRSVW